MKFVILYGLLWAAGWGGPPADDPAATALNDSSAYQLVKKAKDIALYEKWYELSPGEPARQLKALFTLHAPVDSVLALLKNEAKGTDWNSNTRVCKMLPQQESAWITYLQYDLPWPVDDQDCVLQYFVNHRTKDLVTVEFHTVRSVSFPEEEDVSRIPYIKGKWILNITPDAIEAEYYITTSPNKSLPRWITDPIIRNNLINTIHAFRSLL